MSVTGSIDTTMFNAALADLNREIGGDNKTWLINAGKFLMKPLDIRTPSLKKRTKSIKKLIQRAKDADTEAGADFWLRRLEWVLSFQDRAKAGWWAPWVKLGAPGKPRIKNEQIRSRVKTEGGLVDNSSAHNNPFIIIFNTAPHIEELDAKKSIVQSALDFQTAAMERQLQSTYQKRLRKH